MKYCIIVHYHELSLKGKNRPWFQKKLILNIRKQFTGLEFSNIKLIASRIIISDINKEKWQQYKAILKCIIGVKNSLLMAQVKTDMKMICDISYDIVKNCEFESFRVSARRQNKELEFTSQDVNINVGSHIVKKLNKSVKLKNSDLTIFIEAINDSTYIGYEKVDSYGGLPIGTSESALSMLSSGIDSPVASFEVFKRGVELSYIHFHSSPVTSKQSIYNVERILEILNKYQIECNLYLIPLLEIQQHIMDKIDSKSWILLFRRAMVNISNKICQEINAKAIITGENIGQVASQTLTNLSIVDEASSVPIIRPLAGMNKEEIINKAIDINTYDISIEPYEDCCSYFVPPHPETKSNLNRIKKMEKSLEMDCLISNSLDKIEIKKMDYYE